MLGMKKCRECNKILQSIVGNGLHFKLAVRHPFSHSYTDSHSLSACVCVCFISIFNHFTDNSLFSLANLCKKLWPALQSI